MGRAERALQPGRSALDRFGYDLRRLRKERGYSLARLAGVVYVSADLIQKIEVAERRASRELTEQLDAALRADGMLLESWERCSEEIRSRGAVGVVVPSGSGPGQGVRVIEALGVLGSDQLGAVVDGLGELVDHYAHTICALSPAEVYDELLSVRSYASGILRNAGRGSLRSDIVLAVGWLSSLLAVAACDMGEHAAARVWCFDAERRSQDAGHPELAAWAVLTRAMIAWYQRQPRESVTLAARGQQVVPIGTVAHAKLAAQEMRAAAMIGDSSRMAAARRYAGKAIAALPPDAKTTGAFSIALGEDPPYTATSLLFLGNYREAVPATNRVIETVYRAETRQRGENPSSYARSLLILGLAQAGMGRAGEAAAAGQAALSGSRPAWPTLVLAEKLNDVLARDFPDASEVTEYNSVYLEAAVMPSGYRPERPAIT
jgi:hypothetical protein